MRVVVMDKEMVEPLTVIEVAARFFKDRRSGSRIVMAVPENFGKWLAQADRFHDAVPALSMCRTVSLRMEPIVTSDGFGGKRILHWLLVPDDEELALLLRAAFLPGQLTEVRRREAREWFRGAIGAPPPEAP